MTANSTTVFKWTQCDRRSVTEMVEHIQSRYETLDPRRKYMFIEWLRAHSNRVKAAVSICEGWTAWLEGLPCENLGREFRLIMAELDWWSDLDERSLTRMMLAVLAGNGAK